MIRRILIGLGGGPCSAASLRAALDLARRHGAAATGLTVTDTHGLEVAMVPDALRHSPLARHVADVRVEELRSRVLRSVEEFEQECSAAEVPRSVIRADGDPLDSLISAWRYHDLVVVGLNGFFDYGIAPEPREALFRLFAAGVRPILAVACQPREIRSALIAYHGTPDAAKAMKRFVQMRLWPDLEMHVACFERPEPVARELLRDAAEYVRSHGYRVTTHHDPGVARKRLLPLAASVGADILVMGSSPRSLVLRKILGDTLLTAIHESDRPLFLSH